MPYRMSIWIAKSPSPEFNEAGCERIRPAAAGRNVVTGGLVAADSVMRRAAPLNMKFLPAEWFAIQIKRDSCGA